MSGKAARQLFIAALSVFLASCQAVVVHEVRSSYSHIQVVDHGSRRALIFLGENPLNAIETIIDLREPHRLQHPYARTMMAGLIYRPDASACLLVGLGGGALVRFLDRHFPEILLDVVEIDPVVVSVSREFFGTAPGPRTRIFVEDGLQYLRRVPDRYDLILMNAHLHPGACLRHRALEWLDSGSSPARAMCGREGSKITCRCCSDRATTVIDANGEMWRFFSRFRRGN
jgi:hypothetical protein